MTKRRNPPTRQRPATRSRRKVRSGFRPGRARRAGSAVPAWPPPAARRPPSSRPCPRSPPAISGQQIAMHHAGQVRHPTQHPAGSGPAGRLPPQRPHHRQAVEQVMGQHLGGLAHGRQVVDLVPLAGSVPGSPAAGRSAHQPASGPAAQASAKPGLQFRPHQAATLASRVSCKALATGSSSGGPAARRWPPASRRRCAMPGPGFPAVLVELLPHLDATGPGPACSPSRPAA